MSEFPLNNPRDIGGIENMVELFSCIISGKNAVYISAPITTGERFVSWYANHGHSLESGSQEYDKEHYRQVIQPNRDGAKARISELRQKLSKVKSIVVDPTPFNWPEWNQDDYRYFWGKVLERYITSVIFLDGWQYSRGCAFEFLSAIQSGAETLNEAQTPIDLEIGLRMVEEAISQYREIGLSTIFLERVVNLLKNRVYLNTSERIPESAPERQASTGIERSQLELLKDETLDRLAMSSNVAQFVSFSPGPSNNLLECRYSRISGYQPNHCFSSTAEAVEHLLQHSVEGKVNIRSFQVGKKKGEPLVYGLEKLPQVLVALEQKASENKYTIVNETIDINDGGVSGVVLGNVLEFSPGDTPKCVDKPGVCRLPRQIGINLLEKVYGFRPTLNFPFNYRVEFSIHPKKCGIRHSHTITWELEEVEAHDSHPDIQWPNNFSMMLGDKAYGLLVADTLGLPVPYTTIVNRHVAPFSIGMATGTSETWIRTCPTRRAPGKYPTYFGWTDPFKLIAKTEESDLNKSEFISIASILAQESVNPQYSGSLIPSLPDGKTPIIEGIKGKGDEFMLGNASPQKIPGYVKEAVSELYDRAFELLGPIEIEWVYDGNKVWIVQLHNSQITSSSEIIFPGDPKRFIDFDVSKGLEALRELISGFEKAAEPVGVVLAGDVGITSHFGDLLRKAKIPSKVSGGKSRLS